MDLKQFKVGTFNLCNLALPNHPFQQDRIYQPAEYQQKKPGLLSN